METTKGGRLWNLIKERKVWVELDDEQMETERGWGRSHVS